MLKQPIRYSRRAFLWTVGKAGAAAYLSLGALGRGIPHANAQASGKVVVGYLPVNAETVIYRGVRDFWKEQGLNIELFRAAGGPAILEAMMTGGVPVGDIGNGPAVIAAARGFPFYYLTLGSLATPQNTYTRIMVKSDSAIRTVDDLRGRTIALHQRGTMEDLSLGALEKKFGVKKSELKIALVPYPNQAQALTQGLVDAIYASPPGDTIAEHKFGARTLVKTSDFLPWLGYSTLAVRRDFADKNPEVIKQLVRGWTLTARWIRDNAAEARRTSNEFLGIPPDIGAHVNVPQWIRNPLPCMQNVSHIYHMLVGAQTLKPLDDPATLINEYFVEPATRFTLPALEEIGIVPDPLQKSMIEGEYPLLPRPNSTYSAPWDDKLRKA